MALLRVTRFRGLSVVSSLLILATMAAGIWIGGRASHLFEAVDRNWTTFDRVSEQKVAYLTRIHAALGFGGLSRHVKDYVLHGEPSALARIETDLDAAKISIQSYRLLDINVEEKVALQRLDALVRDIEQRLKTVPGLVESGLSAREVDLYVQGDGKIGVAALDNLRWAWRGQARRVGEAMSRASDEGMTLIRYGSILLPVMLGIGVMVLWLIRRLSRQVAAYQEEKRALQFSERRFRDLAANVPGVIFQWVERRGGDRGYLYVSPRCEELYGVKPEVLRRDWQALNFHPDDRKRYLQTVREAFERKSEWSFEGRVLTPDGEQKWWRGVSKPVPINDDEVIFNGVMIDISTQKRLEEELRALATTDALTGIANRRSFLHGAEAEIERARRYREPLTAMMLDLDRFKGINDSLGHAAGDAALKAFTATVRASLRDPDLFGRLGGEEFGILLPETDAVGARALAERIRRAVAAAVVRWEGPSFTYTVSIGVAAWVESDDSIECALSRADVALYEAKQTGRNKVVVATGRFDAAASGEDAARPGGAGLVEEAVEPS